MAHLNLVGLRTQRGVAVGRPLGEGSRADFQWYLGIEIDRTACRLEGALKLSWDRHVHAHVNKPGIRMSVHMHAYAREHAPVHVRVNDEPTQSPLPCSRAHPCMYACSMD